MHAILSASANETSMRGLRASIHSCHGPAGAPRRHTCRTTEPPPMISSRPMVRSPLFDMLPRRCSPGSRHGRCIRNAGPDDTAIFLAGPSARRMFDPARALGIKIVAAHKGIAAARPGL